MADTCALCMRPKAPGSAYFCAEHQARTQPRNAPAAILPPKSRHGWPYVVAVLIVLGIAAAVVAAVAAGSNGGGAGGEHNSVAAGPARMLADVDGATGSALNAYVQALNVWDADCTQDRAESAGTVYATLNDERRNGGPDDTELATMGHLIDSVPASVAPTDCTQIAAAYLVMVEPKR